MDDTVNPSYYKEVYPFEVIDMLRKMLSKEEFIGYCLGNELKYRMRAGIKSDRITEDILKAEWYRRVRGE